MGNQTLESGVLLTREFLEKDTFVYLSIKKKQPKAFFGMEYG